MTILWLSKHSILPIQEKELQRIKQKLNISGEIIFSSKEMKYNSFLDANVLYQNFTENNIKCVVCNVPLSVLAVLLERNKRNNNSIVFLYPEMKLLHKSCNKGCRYFNRETDFILFPKNSPSRHYRFDKFLKIKEIKLIFENI